MNRFTVDAFVENSFALNVTKIINEIKNKSFYFIFSAASDTSVDFL